MLAVLAVAVMVMQGAEAFHSACRVVWSVTGDRRIEAGLQDYPSRLFNMSIFLPLRKL